YLEGEAAKLDRAGTTSPGGFVSTWTIESTASAGGQSAQAGPGLLRMALSAVKSASRFISSGLNTGAPQVHEKRMRSCVSGEHHTGVRCRLCGCFTSVKAWLPYEDCPIEKWPK